MGIEGRRSMRENLNAGKLAMQTWLNSKFEAVADAIYGKMQGKMSQFPTFKLPNTITAAPLPIGFLGSEKIAHDIATVLSSESINIEMPAM